MKRNASIAVVLAPLCGLAGLAAWAGPQALPTPFPEARYARMSKRSPFAVATAAATPAAAAPGFAAQLFVDGVAHYGDTDYVGIKSRDLDKPVAIFVAVGTTTEDGLKVERVQWSDETGKSTVEVSKGGEKATLEFDESQQEKNGAAMPMDMPARMRQQYLRQPIQLPPGFQPMHLMPGGRRPAGYPFNGAPPQ